MSEGKILVVDDEKMIRWTLNSALSKEGYEVLTVESGEEALEIAGDHSLDVIILDITLPGIDGIEVLEEIKKSEPSTAVVMITAHKEVSLAVSAMKLGAFDYIEKPFDVDRINIVVSNAMERRKLSREVEYYRKEKRDKYGFSSIIGESTQIRAVIEVARKVSRSEAATVLLQGESGTGKDLLAMAIHYESSRATKPFMPINLTALPDELLESELMGHEKGAFTDAKTTKKGLFEVASGGTIYLDEIGDMKPGLQAKLLRFIETKAFKRVGGHEDRIVDVRIIAATNKNLDEVVKEGRFREDLFYRLNVIPITLPPLRERREDIMHLADHFLAEFGREFKRPVKGFSRQARAAMAAYDWPGNVRELKNAIERALILGSGEQIRSDDLTFTSSFFDGSGDDDKMDDRLPGTGTYAPGEKSAGTGIDHVERPEGYGDGYREESFRLPDTGMVLEDLEMDLLKQALEKTGGNQTKAAVLLGLSRDALRYRMKKFGLDNSG